MICYREAWKRLGKLTGAYTIVDIGSSYVKVMSVVSSGSEAKVQDFDVFELPSNLIRNSVIVSVEGISNFIVEALTTLGIKSKRIAITSSCLGIVNIPKEYICMSESDVEQKFSQDPDGKRFPNNTLIRSLSLYGKYNSDTDTHHSCIISTASIEFFNALCDYLAVVGITVLSIESTATSTANLAKLTHYTYDDANRLLIDIGNTAKLYVILNGVVRLIDTVDVELSSVLDSVAKDLSITRQVLHEALRKVGFNRSEESATELYNIGILVPEYYFSVLQENLQDFFVLLDSRIADCKTDYSIAEDQVYVLGGFISCDGIRTFSSHVMHVLDFSESFGVKEFSITNKSGYDMSCVYANCIGVLMKSTYKITCNLYPREKLSKSVDSVLVGLSKAIAVTLVFAILISSGNCGYTVYNWLTLQQVTTKLSEVSTKKSSLVDTNTKLDSYVEATNAASGYMSELLQFVSLYNNDFIVVTSIDSETLLPKAKKTADPAEQLASSESKEKEKAPQFTPHISTDSSSDSTSSSSTTEGGQTSEQNSDSIKPIDNQLILRGYSISTAAISQLYVDLKKFDFIKDVSMKGISREILPSLETIYIYEISLTL